MIKRGSPEWKKRRAAYMVQLMANIEKHGWVLQGVLGEMPFAYTVGMTDRALPELLISGLPMDLAHSLLSHIVAIHSEITVQPGKMLHLDGPRFLPIEAPLAEVGIADEVYQKNVDVIQLIWPDDEGRWPGDPDVDQRWTQEVFGPYERPDDAPRPGRTP